MDVCRQEGEDEVWVLPPEKGLGARAPPLLFALQGLLRALPDVIVAGVPSVQRAVISQDTISGKMRWVMPCNSKLSVVSLAIFLHDRWQGKCD